MVIVLDTSAQNLFARFLCNCKYLRICTTTTTLLLSQGGKHTTVKMLKECAFSHRQNNACGSFRFGSVFPYFRQIPRCTALEMRYHLLLSITQSFLFLQCKCQGGALKRPQVLLRTFSLHNHLKYLHATIQHAMLITFTNHSDVTK